MTSRVRWVDFAMLALHGGASLLVLLAIIELAVLAERCGKGAP